MGRRRYLVVALVLAIPLLVAGCAKPARPWQEHADGPRVVATTTQVADMAAVIGSDRVDLVRLLKPGIDAHDYEPSPADVEAIATAQLVVENGVGLESWLHDTIESSGYDGPMVDTSQGVRLRQVGGEPDPHIWQDPRNVMVMAANIERGLANRKVVTNHDAFGYYLDRYHLQLVGSVIPSFDSSAELSGRDVRDLVAKVKATGVRAIFSETSLPPRAAETIGREAGVKVVTGEDALYGDSLGPPGSDGDSYIRMIRHNTRTIVSNLSGT